jgi:outer membrane protein assembly factor BamE (lipoprotein component of BamABCDE complex)
MSDPLPLSMAAVPGSRPLPLIRRARRLAASGLALVLLVAASGCVQTKNGEAVPRGDQRFPFTQVEERARKLQPGLTRSEVMLLLGSPAEIDESDSVWIYLPERYAVLVPARALRLEFDGNVLKEHGYRAIVLGARL